MRTRTVFIGLGVLSVAVGAGAWLLTRPTPVPVAPIDYKAELVKLTLEGQSTDPNAKNGWDELLAVGKAAVDAIGPIEEREWQTDENLKNGGRESEIEVWRGVLVLGWDCREASERDTRIADEARHAIELARLLERIDALDQFGVFVLDFDQRLPMQIRTGSIDAVTPFGGRAAGALYTVVRGATQDAIDAKEWGRAIRSLEGTLLIARALSLQAHSIVMLIGRNYRNGAVSTVTEAITSGRQLAPEFLIGVQEAFDRTRVGLPDRLLAAERLASMELADVFHEKDVTRGVVGWWGRASGRTPSVHDQRRAIDASVERARALLSADLPRMYAELDRWQRELEGSVSSADAGSIAMHTVAKISTSERAWNQREDALRILIALALSTSTHGSPPQTLDALVPEFLAELPKDPWAPDGKYRYKPGATMKDIVLYTVGWDGADDGGHYIPARPD